MFFPTSCIKIAGLLCNFHKNPVQRITSLRNQSPRIQDNMRLLGREHLDRFPISIAGSGVARWIGPQSRAHTHTTNFAIEQITLGNSIFIQNGRAHLVEQGDVYVLQAGSHHEYSTGPAGVLHKRYVGFDGPALMTVFRTLGLIGCDVIRPSNSAAITRLLRESYALLDAPGKSGIRRLSLVTYELLVLLSADLPPAYPSPLGIALSFIELNLGGRLTIQGISDRAGIDTASLLKLFTTHLGMSPIQYLIGQRLAWAQRLLINSEKPIKEISSTVGYCDQLHFSAQFRKHIGLSPRAYRARASNQFM